MHRSRSARQVTSLARSSRDVGTVMLQSLIAGACRGIDLAVSRNYSLEPGSIRTSVRSRNTQWCISAAAACKQARITSALASNS